MVTKKKNTDIVKSERPAQPTEAEKIAAVAAKDQEYAESLRRTARGQTPFSPDSTAPGAAAANARYMENQANKAKKSGGISGRPEEYFTDERGNISGFTTTSGKTFLAPRIEEEVRQLSQTGDPFISVAEGAAKRQQEELMVSLQQQTGQNFEELNKLLQGSPELSRYTRLAQAGAIPIDLIADLILTAGERSGLLHRKVGRGAAASTIINTSIGKGLLSAIGVISSANIKGIGIGSIFEIGSDIDKTTSDITDDVVASKNILLDVKNGNMDYTTAKYTIEAIENKVILSQGALQNSIAKSPIRVAKGIDSDDFMYRQLSTLAYRKAAIDAYFINNDSSLLDNELRLALVEEEESINL